VADLAALTDISRKCKGSARVLDTLAVPAKSNIAIAEIGNNRRAWLHRSTRSSDYPISGSANELVELDISAKTTPS
jgi:hypothetical protein